MKPDNVCPMLLIGPSQIGTSMLFQCAMYFADQGEKVLYISSSALNALPPPVHGIPHPSSSSLSHVRFMYLPRWQDLSQHLYTLHQHAHIPNVILLDGLNHYGSLPENKIHNEKYEEKMHIALVCASLLDATSVCAKYTKKRAVLITSFQADINSVSMIDIFFTDKIWLMESDDQTDSVTITNITYPKEESKTRIEFKSWNCDRKLVLNKILKILNCEVKDLP